MLGNKIKNSCIILLMLFSACSSNSIMSRKVGRQFKDNVAIQRYQVGFALYSLADAKMIYQQDADKYFTPASNTKLYTFFACLHLLPEKMPALKYVVQNDSLIFWGTGDPSFFQSAINDQSAYQFLKQSDKKLFFSPGRYTGNAYGEGWAWDDYNDYYQPEISELPIMDNLITATFRSAAELNIAPKTMQNCFKADSTANKNPFTVKRDFYTNTFKYPAVAIPVGFKQQIPYQTSPLITVEILTDTLQKPVNLIQQKLPGNAQTLFGANRDSVLKHMMLPSDNFIAEHLLLACANQIGDTLNTPKAIAYINKKYLSFLPDKVKWVDGSGLSRQNLFTPRDNVLLLDSIFKKVNNEEKLFDFFPAGGKSGTLKNAYPKTNKPFVFGKTGTLGGVHNQSGYIKTKKGKIYAFSFMNNNFVQPIAQVRAEMVKIMSYIYQNF